MTNFNEFINFGLVADKDKRKQLADAVYNHLRDGTPPSLSEADTDTDNFKKAAESVISNKTMLELCAKDKKLAAEVTRDILNSIDKTKRQIRESENPFEREERLLEEFKKADKESFKKDWEVAAPVIQENYKQQELDTAFYHDEFQKSLNNAPEEGENGVSFESVKEHFMERWECLFLKKKISWEFKIIDEARRQFCEELYSKIENLKKLQEILEPFTGELGRLWDMSRGRWQKVNFDVLKRYAELLQKDAALRELAEMLGRMRQAEREYEEELFADIKITPRWRAEHAAKSELVGIHESDDISSILPAEAALLSGETTELLFYKKFAEKKLQTFEYQAKVLSYEKEQFQNIRQRAKEEAKGPFIICVDTSGSMHGIPETVAKTLCFALLKMAVRENRKCYLISFSTHIETLDLTDVKNNLEKLIEFLSMSFHGGTDAAPAMREALRMLATEDYKRADVVMVSDFVMSSFDEQTKNEILAHKEKKTKFHSLVVGGSGNKNTIVEFDSNWSYNTSGENGISQLVKDMNRSAI